MSVKRAMIGFIHRLLRIPCHTSYSKSNDPNMKQGFHRCGICGELCLERPRLTDAAIKELIQ